MKPLSQSKTVWFNVIMAGVEAAHGVIHLFNGILSAEHFAIVSMVLGVVHAMGGVYLRTITNVPISNISTPRSS